MKREWDGPPAFPARADRVWAGMMKAAVAALALAFAATAATAQGSGQLTPEKRRDYFNPGGQVEIDNPGIRQRLHDAEINRRAQEEIRPRRKGPQFTPEGRCSPRDRNYPAC
jgi:hypothetical protein